MDRFLEKALAAACAAGTGAALAYCLDPQSGPRRRARLRGQALHAARDIGEGMDRVAADILGRSHGIAPKLRHLVLRQVADDRILSERVRAKLGHYLTHPKSVEVETHGGQVILRGPVPAGEARNMLSHVRRVPGVKEVLSRIDPMDWSVAPGSPAARDKRDARLRWSPSLRFSALTLGSALAVAGLRRRGIPGWAGRTAGLALCLRAFTNRPVLSLLGLGGRQEPVRLRKTVNIDAPLDRVFEFWIRYENFPRFMPHVLDSSKAEWETEITRLVENEALAWKSVAGAFVPNTGEVRFQPNGKGGTTVDIKLDFQPFAGGLGHGLAKFLGADPKRRLNREVLRLKACVEKESSGFPGAPDGVRP